jgi:hypothetical protein
MEPVRLTASHVREFVRISRTDFQRWLTVLPPYATHQTHARKARIFEARDLVFFAVVHFLTSSIGLRLDAVASFSECLRNDLTKLSDLSTESRWVVLRFSMENGWSIDAGASQESDVHLKMDVSQIWFRIHQFLGLTSDWKQSNLPLGLHPVSDTTKWQLRA